MDPFRLCLAFGPLAVYLFLLGMINLGRRPFLTSGGRDLAALGVAVCGLIIVGPVELFMPHRIAQGFAEFAWVYWLLLFGLYFLVLSLLVMAARPRLAIYNASEEEVRGVLTQVFATLDGEACLVGESVVLPNLGVECHIDSFRSMRCVSLTAVGVRQSLAGWRQLESALALALREIEVGRNPAGVSMLLFGAVMAGFIVVRWVHDPQAVAKSFAEMFGL